jgi:NADH-quinone oxidoreductase subunit L
MSAGGWGWLVLAFPLAGSIVCSLLYRALPPKLIGLIGSLAILLSFLSAIGALIKLEDLPEEKRSVISDAYNYAHSVGINVKMGILVDPLSVFMILVVSGVSFLIHVYSTAYMGSDRGYARFFAYLNYFVFSMLLLVLANNFVVLIIGWAFVGAASYLLISFWYRRSSATYAGIKAFVMNVIGDIGLVIGAFLLFDHTGSLDYKSVFSSVERGASTDVGWLVAACIMLLVGAFAKSAQVPLHTWLPDAMEGPTPVSALIHAATMVTAGVYLIARMWPLFEHAPAAAEVGAIGGTVTLFIAATIALVVTDLKRVIAYSTMSQIGYMILGVSIGAYTAGLFHLMTHAFFKALLFMAAGSVISAMAGEQNMDRMGGFRRAMPFTFICFLVGSFALAGIFPLAGLFSKDAILSFAIDERGGFYAVLGVIGYIGSALTAFYAGRMLFRTFFGEMAPEAEQLSRGELAHGEHRNPATGEEEDTDVGFPGPEHHIAEREIGMKVAMTPLAILAAIGGALGIPGVTTTLEKFLEPSFAGSKYFNEVPSTSIEWVGLTVGGVLAIAGMGFAWWAYERRAGFTLRLRDRYRPLHDFLFNKWDFDELYDHVFVYPSLWLGRFGRTVVESRLVQGVMVGGASWVVGGVTTLARSLQTGYLRAYALLLLFGVSALVLYFLIVST